MNTHADAAAHNSHANKETLTLRCRHCGKIHRVRGLPKEASGRIAERFLFTCIACGKTEIRSREDIVHQALAEHAPAGVTPSRSLSASPTPATASGANSHPSPPRQSPRQGM